MSASDLFSSPSKQATQSGQAQQQLAQNEIGQAEQYVDTSNQNERNAIAAIGTNPYFGSTSATSSNPNGNPVGTPVALNPANVVSFGGNGSTATNPGSMSALISQQAAKQNAPPSNNNGTAT